MARYSSDSDSDRSKHRRKHYGRTRSSSSDSSGSSSYKRKSAKHSKTKRRHRTRSRSRDRDRDRERERSSKSYKYSREDSRDRERRKQKSRRSRSQSAPSHRKQRRSISREKSTSRSSSSQSIAKPIVTLTEKVQAIPKDDFSIAPNIKESVLEEINSEGFAPKQFTSTAQNKESSKSKPIVIDITADTIHVPPITTIVQSDSIFHTSIMGDQEGRFDKWVKKLYLIRQKAQPESIN
ncbi:probable splicing factor, arginine/serine-rich 7 [Belonocnema kinseyi]|uniref:probable splicing factor, arginine/serine-rich 7 n=1 Tax=Belonocnema kinseyi TaxID=2817044 RepID=UPI00143D9EF4|nr:probable splicing factor, arginine/serine-rich 7 [Belonocnema kinseyi]